MKRLLVLFVIILGSTGVTTPQSPRADFEKIRKIKLLETTREEVIEILSPGSLDFHDRSEFHFMDFYLPYSIIRVIYSSGDCSAESEDWDVAKGKVTEIEFVFREPPRVGQFHLVDFSGFRKEQTDWQRNDVFIRHDKTAGVAVGVFFEKIDQIIFRPSAAKHSRLCDRPEVREYYANKWWVRGPWRGKKVIVDYSLPASVVDLTLSRNVESPNTVAVSVKAYDPDNDILTFNYKTSGGKVIGNGANVTWDLTGVPPGTYTITAAVDDGLGLRGKYVTKPIVVK